jgi:hypothetical protein
MTVGQSDSGSTARTTGIDYTMGARTARAPIVYLESLSDWS